MVLSALWRETHGKPQHEQDGRLVGEAKGWGGMEVEDQTMEVSQESQRKEPERGWEEWESNRWMTG